FVHAHDDDTLGGASDDADPAHTLAIDDAVARDQHQLVARQHALDRNDLTGRLVDTEVDDALAAPGLQPVFLDVGALAASVLGYDEQRCALGPVRPADDHADNDVVATQADAAHARRDATHLAHVTLLEADRHTVARCQNHVVAARSDLHVDQLITVVDVDRIDADHPHVAVRVERRLLHGAAA